MNQHDSQLIQGLVRDLETVKPSPTQSFMMFVWCSFSLSISVLALNFFGSFRPDWWQDLNQSPLFALEFTLWGALGPLFFTIYCLLLKPGRLPRLSRTPAVPLMTLILLVISLLASTGWPYLNPSELGKRPWCMWEILIYSLPSFALGLWFWRRGHALRPMYAGAFLGIASAALLTL